MKACARLSPAWGLDPDKADEAFEAGEDFADWLDNHPEFTPDYEAEIRAGHLSQGVSHNLQDELQAPNVLLMLVSLASNGQHEATSRLLLGLLNRAITKTREYDAIQAQEAYERENDEARLTH
jgi:hypothetical protein